MFGTYTNKKLHTRHGVPLESMYMRAHTHTHTTHTFPSKGSNMMHERCMRKTTSSEEEHEEKEEGERKDKGKRERVNEETH